MILRDFALPFVPSSEERDAMKVLMTEEQSIIELINRAKRGDQSAFGRLALRCRDKLHSFIKYRIRPELRAVMDAEALANDTLARAFESLERFEGQEEDSWNAWLAGIAKKVVLKEIDQLNRTRALEINREIATDQASPSRTMRREERFDRLQEALEGLSADHRRVIRLCRIEGLSMRDAAKEMNRSPDAMKMLLWRALQELKDKFGDTESLHLPNWRLGSQGGCDD